MGQIVAVVARRETSTHIIAVVAINQSKPRLLGKVLFTRLWTNFWTDEFSPYTTRLRGNVQILLQYCLYRSVQILPASALQWLFNQRRGTRIYAFNGVNCAKIFMVELTEPVKLFDLLLITTGKKLARFRGSRVCIRKADPCKVLSVQQFVRTRETACRFLEKKSIFCINIFKNCLLN